MKVWLLMFFIPTNASPLVATIDNLTSKASCEFAGTQMIANAKEMRGSLDYNFRCIEVEKTTGGTPGESE